MNHTTRHSKINLIATVLLRKEEGKIRSSSVSYSTNSRNITMMNMYEMSEKTKDKDKWRKALSTAVQWPSNLADGHRDADELLGISSGYMSLQGPQVDLYKWEKKQPKQLAVSGHCHTFIEIEDGFKAYKYISISVQIQAHQWHIIYPLGIIHCRSLLDAWNLQYDKVICCLQLASYLTWVKWG